MTRLHIYTIVIVAINMAIISWCMHKIVTDLRKDWKRRHGR